MPPDVGKRVLAETSFRLGEWLVEPRLNRVSRGDESIQIELKMMDVLVCLAGHTGELVTRQELIDTVWSVEYITEKTLTRAVAELRRTLGGRSRKTSVAKEGKRPSGALPREPSRSAVLSPPASRSRADASV